MTPSPLFDALFVKIRAWLLTLVPSGTEIVQGLANGVPQPAGGHIVITRLFDRRLRTNQNTYDDDGYTGSVGGTKSIEMGTEFTVQFDYYGPSASDWATVVSTLFRDESTVVALAPECAPLHCDEGRQIPLITGEERYLLRVCSTAALQYNPITTIPQQFADEAAVGLVDAEILP